MAPQDIWLTAREAAGLPEIPSTEFRARAKLKKLGAPSRIRSGTVGGGGREYNAAYFPAAAQAALLLRPIQAAAPAPVPAPVPAVTIATRPASRPACACADARALLVRQIEVMAPLCGGITKSVAQLAQQLATGVAATDLMAAANEANLRKRNGAAISARTLFDWHSRFQSGGWSALLPEPAQPSAVKALDDDVAAVLKRYGSTHGSARNLSHVAQAVNLELGNALDDWRSLYDRSRRALAKVDRVQLIKARHTGAERAAKLPFKRRDTTVLKPLDVVLVDGHTYKARVRHPDHGQPFAPEVTAVIDACTRYVLGFSVSLSESTIAVGDAMRRAVEGHGVPGIVYSDNGSGESAKYFDCPVVGLFERLGCHHEFGIPRHPQGHGLIERLWQTTMIPSAKQFDSYQGRDVDDNTLRDLSLELAREQRAVKRAEATGEVVRLSSKCPPWAVFIEEVGRAFAEYNQTHRHRGLPKHTEGALAGKHMTPAEAMQALLVPDLVHRLDQATLRTLFMPAKLCTATRGEVRFLNQTYFSNDLMQVDGDKVRVHYDLFDPARVWVWTIGGDFVCEAKWQGNRIDYFPKAVVDMAREKRVRAAIKRREAQIDTARRELQPTLPAPTDPAVFIGDLQMVERVFERAPEPVPVQPAESPDARPFFDSAADRYEWLMRHRSACTPAEGAWLSAYADGPEYESLRDYFASRGLDWPRGDDEVFDQAG